METHLQTEQPVVKPKRPIWRRPRWIIGAIVFVLVLIIIGRGVLAPESAVDSDTRVPVVDLLSVDDYQEQFASVQVFGVVESEAQADIKSEVSVPVQGVYVALGERVVQGQPLVEFVHEDFDAQLDAQLAAIDRAQGAVDLLVTGPREEDREQLRLAVEQARAQRDIAAATLETTRVSVETTFDSAYGGGIVSARDLYADLIEGIVTVAEYRELYFNCSSKLCFDIARHQQEALRVLLEENDAGRWNAQTIQRVQEVQGIGPRLSALETSDIDVAQLEAIFDEMILAGGSIRAALLLTREAFDAGISSGFTTTDEAAVETARGSADTAIASIISARGTLESATVGMEQGDIDSHASVKSAQATLALREAGLASAEQAYQAVVSGPRDLDLVAARASLREAQAAYGNVLSQQRKYIVLAPFDGTVASVPARVGEPVPLGTTVVSVVNEDLVDIVAHVSDRDHRNIRVGDFAVINGSVEAIVTSLSPALNATTQQVEMRLSVLGPVPTLTIGTTVDVVVQALPDTEARVLPLSAVKLTPDGAFVYTVDGGVVVATSVEVGGTVETSIEILSGLPEGMVVSDVRGLRDGDAVNVR